MLKVGNSRLPIVHTSKYEFTNTKKLVKKLAGIDVCRVKAAQDFSDSFFNLVYNYVLILLTLNYIKRVESIPCLRQK